MKKESNSDYWLMVFYFVMAVLTATIGIFYQDFSWLLLGVGSSCLGLGSRLSLASKGDIKSKNTSNKSELFSRVGFLFLERSILGHR